MAVMEITVVYSGLLTLYEYSSTEVLRCQVLCY